MQQYLIGGLIGLGIGIGGTYLVLKKKMQAQFDSDLEDLKDYYYEKFGKDVVEYDHTSDERDLTEEEQEEAYVKASSEKLFTAVDSHDAEKRELRGANAVKAADLIESLGEKNVSRYHKVFREKHPDLEGLEAIDIAKVTSDTITSITIERDDIQLELDPDVSQEEIDALVMDPELFPVGEFNEQKSIHMATGVEYRECDNELYDVSSIQYYAGDDILVNDEVDGGEILVDKMGILGSYAWGLLRDWYSEETQQRAEGDSLYIRNDIRETYYEVLYNEGPYYD